MTSLLLGMRAIYIILMGLPCWARLSRWIPLRVALPNSWWWINFTDLGFSVSCSRGRPSAKFPLYGSVIGQIPLVLVESYKVSARSYRVSAFRPSLLRSRPRPYRYNKILCFLIKLILIYFDCQMNRILSKNINILCVSNMCL